MKTIMIVDDEEAIRSGIAFVLEARNYKVIEARNGQECLELLGTAPVDMIILDLNMPVLEGVKVLEKVRQQEQYQNLPILVYSGNVRKESHRYLHLLALATDIIEKPGDLPLLLELISLYVQ